MAVKEKKIVRVGAPAVLSEEWKRVKFGDVVRDVKVTVDPETSGLERYVAGEHMNTDDLHIRQWGTIGDGYLGPAFHRKFVKGQVLYGSRRTYLRKVAVAEFDGICANTTFVLEPKGDDLLPELLPFIMQTESFSTHAVKQSRGSVNPYVNFRDIAWYEFALPPKEEQRRIVEILSSTDDLIEAKGAVKDALIRQQSTCLDQFLTQGIRSTALKSTKVGEGPSHWRFGKVGDFLELQRGFDLTEKESVEGNVPVVSSSGIAYFHNTAMVQPPGVVTGRKGKLGDVFFLDTPYWPHDTSLWVKDFKGNEPRFIFWLLKFLRLEKLDAATAVPTLNRNNVHPLEVVIPPLDEQREIAKLLDSMVNTLKIAESDLESLKKLKRALVKTMLEGHV